MQIIKRTIRRREVLSKTGLSASTIYNLENAGDFPMHFMLTPRCAVWDEHAIELWLESRRGAEISPAKGPDVTLRKAAHLRTVASENPRGISKNVASSIGPPVSAAAKVLGDSA